MACICRQMINGLMKAMPSTFTSASRSQPSRDQPAHDVVQPLAALAHALQADAAGLGQADAVGHQDAEELLFARQHEVVEGRERQPFQQGPAIGDGGVGEGRQPFDLALFMGGQQGVEQRVLAGKVVVERAFADADRRRDVAEAGAEKAFFGEEVERRVQDGLSRALPVGVLGACHRN